MQLARYVVRKQRFRHDDNETPNAKGSLFISDPSVRTPPRPMGFKPYINTSYCIIQACNPVKRISTFAHLRATRSSPTLFKFHSFSNASPTLFKAAQWNIKQSRDYHRHFKANITSLARNRARIPHLTHRGDNEHEA
jgi:hypothetical protein